MLEYSMTRTCWATDWTSFGVSKLKRRLHRLFWVYAWQCHIVENLMSLLISYIHAVIGHKEIIQVVFFNPLRPETPKGVLWTVKTQTKCCMIKINLRRKKYCNNIFEKYNLWPLNLYNGPPWLYCIKLYGKFQWSYMVNKADNLCKNSKGAQKNHQRLLSQQIFEQLVLLDNFFALFYADKK